MAEESVKRWVTQWPLDIQPVPGSSTIDWTKVEVVPAFAYDAAQTEIEKLKIELKNLAPIGRYEGHDTEWWYSEATRLIVAQDTAVRILSAIEFDGQAYEAIQRACKLLRPADELKGAEHG